MYVPGQIFEIAGSVKIIVASRVSGERKERNVVLVLCRNLTYEVGLAIKDRAECVG